MNSVTIGMDISDKKSFVIVLDSDGEITDSQNIPNTVESIESYFCKYSGAKVALEAGSHSPWISRVLSGLGFTVYVGNPRKLRVIWQSPNKSDIRDAEMLARIARFDQNLLYPVHHRGEQAHADLSMLKARAMLVECRSDLINHVRGAVKSFGLRLPSCSSESFASKIPGYLPDKLKPALLMVVEEIKGLTDKIRDYDRRIEEISNTMYPETGCLRQIAGVGPITALAYILTLEEPERFGNSRSVGAFLGLTPRRDQSGETDRQLRITKAGNKYLRQLLVGCAQYILGPFGPESDLKEFGLRLAGRGGKNAKRRAVVAVARKLAVLLHRLWITGEVYNAVHKSNRILAKAA